MLLLDSENATINSARKVVVFLLPHPRTASFAFCVEAGGKSLGRSQGDSPRPRQLHSRGSRSPGQPSSRRVKAPGALAHGPRLTERAGPAAPWLGHWGPSRPRPRLRCAPQRQGATALGWTSEIGRAHV